MRVCNVRRMCVAEAMHRAEARVEEETRVEERHQGSLPAAAYRLEGSMVLPCRGVVSATSKWLDDRSLHQARKHSCRLHNDRTVQNCSTYLAETELK